MGIGFGRQCHVQKRMAGDLPCPPHELTQKSTLSFAEYLTQEDSEQEIPGR